jgi:hypothetical protein
MSDTPRTDALHFGYKDDIGMQRHELLDLALALERELAEAKKDAERYRWLRDEAQNTMKQQRAWLASNELDDNIDAAMKEGK